MAVFVAAVSLLASSKVPRGLIAAVFGAGALLACLSFLANRTQHGYYRAARDLKAALEDELEVGDWALATTPGMGSLLGRVGAVRTFLAIMLAALAAADVAGAIVALDSPAQRSQLAIRLSFTGATRPPGPLPVSLSRPGYDQVTGSVPAGSSQTVVNAVPGSYRLTVLAREPCQKDVTVTDDPLQLVSMSCAR